MPRGVPIGRAGGDGNGAGGSGRPARRLIFPRSPRKTPRFAKHSLEIAGPAPPP